MFSIVIPTTSGSFILMEGFAELSFTHNTKAGEARIIIDLTEIQGCLHSTGAGKALVEEVVQQARDHKLNIFTVVVRLLNL